MNGKILLPSLLKIGTQDALTYRADFVMSFVSGISLIVVQFYLWRTVFAHQHSIADYSFADTFTYMALVWVLFGLLETTETSRNIQDQILSGSISLELLYPVSFQKLTVYRCYSRNIVKFILSGIPIFFCALFIFNIQVPDFFHLTVFLISIHISFCIAVGISFIIGVCSVYFRNIEGLLQVERFVRAVLAGTLAPLAFFPAAVSTLAGLLPFQGIIAIPIEIYLGKISHLRILGLLGIQLFWAVVLTAAGAVMFDRARKKMEVFGG